MAAASRTMTPNISISTGDAALLTGHRDASPSPSITSAAKVLEHLRRAFAVPE